MWKRILTVLITIIAVYIGISPRFQDIQSFLFHDASIERSNIIFIIVDDQDLHLDSLSYQPFTQKHLIERGTFFRRHYCTTAVCCPARVSLWTGKAAHNTNVTDVNPPHGGYPKFISQGLNDHYLPVWLQQAGYDTYYTGKLFNAHTVKNYDSPYPAGWTATEFLLDPNTYQYWNATFQRNQNPPLNHEGEYNTDVLAQKAYGLLDEGIQSSKPFFLGIAPIAPHSNTAFHPPTEESNAWYEMTEPIPAPRHEHLFPDAKVPRTQHFNPEEPSGVNWISRLPRQNASNIEYNDKFHRGRLQSMQAVDEMIDTLIKQLEASRQLHNTYIIYTSDNGFHIGQHRTQPGKECGYEEDINVPLIIRGPGVPENKVTDLVTTHTDMVPTIFRLLGIEPHDDFDGQAFSVTEADMGVETMVRHEHVNVEFWGYALEEGKYGNQEPEGYHMGNTYKALRIAGRKYNLYYSVWCNNAHELYDLNSDPYQLHNLLPLTDADSPRFPEGPQLLGYPLSKVATRLDTLLLVLKSCKGTTCVRPWDVLHPNGDVSSLEDALHPRYDDFYMLEQERVSFRQCELGYFVDAEGPMVAAVYKEGGGGAEEGLKWNDWT